MDSGLAALRRPGMTKACTSALRLLRHKSIEERRELRIPIEWQHVRDELVRSHDHHAAPFAIDAAHGEDVLAAFVVGTEHLLVVMQLVPALPRQQEGWHGFDVEL